VLGFVDDGGNLTRSTEYYAFGGIRGGTDPGRIGFAGARRDARTGLVYLRNRFYSPELGRFLSRDPLGVLELARRTGFGVASDRLQTVASRFLLAQDSIPRSVFLVGSAVGGRPGLVGLGSLTQRDPIGFSAGLRGCNHYAYVDATPTTKTDPMGLDAGKALDLRSCEQRWQDCMAKADASFTVCVLLCSPNFQIGCLLGGLPLGGAGYLYCTAVCYTGFRIAQTNCDTDYDQCKRKPYSNCSRTR